MQWFKTGLVVGKFYPPHEGHHLLIRTALDHCDIVHVAVLGRTTDSVSVTTRGNLLYEEYYDSGRVVTHGIIIPPGLADDDSKGWADFTLREICQPECVFSSEDYGPIYAGHMGAQHVMVDRERKTFPISGSAIRADLGANWEWLRRGARAEFCYKIVIAGADSTGKTTLARYLAEKLGTAWVPEYGRLYSEGKYTARRVWGSHEFVSIAWGQIFLEKKLAFESRNGLLVCDTDVLTTAAWHKRYMGIKSEDLEAIAKNTTKKYNLYVIPDLNIPYVDDGMREIDDPEGRVRLHEDITRRVMETGKPFIFTSGSTKQQAQQVIDSLPKKITI